MKWFGLTPERVMARMDRSSDRPVIPSLSQSLWIGASGFCFASLAVFATVAFGERWMYRNLGLAGAYLVWTLLFILLGGSVLSPLVIGSGRWLRFQFLFALAFLLYAVGWIASYFTLRGLPGEVVGSLVGPAILGAVIASAFGNGREMAKIIAVLVVANTLGYFLGEALHFSIRGRAGMMLWGAVYGLGLGAGLGAALYYAQAPLREQARG